MTTHIVAMSRDQVTELHKQFKEFVDSDRMNTMFLVSSDDPNLPLWVRERQWVDRPDAVPLALQQPDSLFVGEVFIIGMSRQLSPEFIRDLGLE